ncbi:hypothetical protein TNCV_3813421 [Trichonephila clavipes]|nr:hypothetical protein TNCV_3813421 [Trichonephila clavipes]
MREKSRRKLEKAGKFKINNKKPSKKQKKERRVSEEIPLDNSGDSFDEDNNNDFFSVYKGYFYAKNVPNVTGFSASNTTNGYTNIAVIVICTE